MRSRVGLTGLPQQFVAANAGRHAVGLLAQIGGLSVHTDLDCCRLFELV